LYMQLSELSYWQGVGGWSILLATTVNTALWLDGRPADRLPKWDLLRLAGIGLLVTLSPGAGDAHLVWAGLYGVLNLLFLPLIARAPVPGDPHPGSWLYRTVVGQTIPSDAEATPLDAEQV